MFTTSEFALYCCPGYHDLEPGCDTLWIFKSYFNIDVPPRIMLKLAGRHIYGATYLTS